jgi:uncharacterized membrane protein YccC
VIASSRKPAVAVIFVGIAANVMPVLAPTNHMNYDTQAFYNLALAMIVGGGIPALAFRLIPPLSPVLRTRRLLDFALRDLRQIATAPLLRSEDWESRIYSRIIALPDSAEPSQRAQLLAALSVGNEMTELRRLVRLLGVDPGLDPALRAIADGKTALARTELKRLDQCLNSFPGSAAALRSRASILMMSEALAQHAAYFDGAPA